jgi:hypothetical protein
MKLFRAFSIAIAILVPAAAIASPAVRAATPCCMNGNCCPDCPFCPSHLHK